MTETAKKSKVTFTLDFNFFSLLTLLIVLFFAYTAHKKNMDNADKMNNLLVKYEQTLDAAIAGDKVTLAQYQKNVKKAVASLSPKEKKLLLALLEIDNKKPL
ncbi:MULTISPECIES: hypothetical protein [Shewanella]|uniref:Uncharacterized protein n=1 Tax=Shewanella japonica TaxID=93973 RepID=A0ABN4YNY6_9GAMM|nr:MULTISPECIES: hypothetical protein [Shewanella]ARD24115.1 hypothetical protein SJ2017_3885 [Shewanella japonica]KPZ69128.1 hypothetical protein AN944_03144 [Shewanella sp. P1-14-1]MBQ4891366.1 hypothetical protein [Shewanella sp. MMG014]OBT04725.1 hypothetical protein A9267_17430 [Shewanella sp. UCD-FRSSP16_17]